MSRVVDVLFMVTFLIIEFSTYLFTMRILFQVPFRKGKKKWITTVGILLLGHILLAIWKGVQISDGLLFLTLGAAFVILLEEHKRRVIALHLSIYLAYSSFAAIMVTFAAFASKMPEQELLNNNWVVLVIDSMPLCLFSLLHCIRKQKTRRLDFTLQVQQIVFMLTGLAGIYIVLGTLQIFEARVGKEPFVHYTKILITAVCFLFLILILWQAIVVNRQNQMAEKMRLNELFDQMKEEHFKEMLIQDETIRRFRHDFRAHMTAMKGYCEQGKQDDLIRYLDQLLKNGDMMTAKTYVGDAGVDAVINQLAERAKQENVKVTIEGGCKRPDRVTSFDFCCILSNILTNAIEACERMEENAAKWIHLQLQDYNQTVYICLQNTAPVTDGIEDNTWKKDKRNHGLGMGNVRRIVEKYVGKMTTTEKDGVYITEIIF